MSVSISSTFSRPADILINEFDIPTASLSSSVILECVVDAGCDTIVFVSPKFAVNEHISKAFKNLCP